MYPAAHQVHKRKEIGASSLIRRTSLLNGVKLQEKINLDQNQVTSKSIRVRANSERAFLCAWVRSYSADAAAMADAAAGVLGVAPPEDTTKAGSGGEAMGKQSATGRASGGKRVGRWAVPPSWEAAYGQQPLNRAIFI